MSWSLHFELKSRDGGEVPIASRRKAGRVLQRCLKKGRNVGFVAIDPTEEEPLKGFVQILLREGSEADFVLLLAALQDFARSEPDLLVTALDEFYLEGEDVLTVGEPRALVDPRVDPTHGAGVFRSDSGAEQGVYRAELPKLDASGVARSFLDELAAKKLILWGGPVEPVVARIAALVQRIEEGRWRGAKAVLRILEDEASIEEVFADDGQIDEIWRRAVNRT